MRAFSLRIIIIKATIISLQKRFPEMPPSGRTEAKHHYPGSTSWPYQTLDDWEVVPTTILNVAHCSSSSK